MLAAAAAAEVLVVAGGAAGLFVAEVLFLPRSADSPTPSSRRSSMAPTIPMTMRRARCRRSSACATAPDVPALICRVGSGRLDFERFGDAARCRARALLRGGGPAASAGAVSVSAPGAIAASSGSGVESAVSASISLLSLSSAPSRAFPPVSGSASVGCRRFHGLGGFGSGFGFGFGSGSGSGSGSGESRRLGFVGLFGCCRGLDLHRDVRRLHFDWHVAGRLRRCVLGFEQLRVERLQPFSRRRGRSGPPGTWRFGRRSRRGLGGGAAAGLGGGAAAGLGALPMGGWAPGPRGAAVPRARSMILRRVAKALPSSASTNSPTCSRSAGDSASDSSACASSRQLVKRSPAFCWIARATTSASASGSVLRPPVCWRPVERPWPPAPSR